MQTTQIENLASIARRYCAWATGADGSAMTERGALQSVTELYAAALQLPPPWNEGLPAEAPDIQLPPAEVDVVQERASKLQRQIYWEIFDPHLDPPDDPVVGHLTDDLGAIYRDIAGGLYLFDSGRRDEALWEWAINFRIHWGELAFRSRMPQLSGEAKNASAARLASPNY